MQIPAQKAMLFVDGSNMLIEMFRLLGLPHHRAEKATATAFNVAMHSISHGVAGLGGHGPPLYVIRRYWFGSVQGSADDLVTAQEALRHAGFSGVLFPKRQGKEKGVDLAVAREMLMQGFLKNYDAAIVVAGDEDYLGLIEDVKRLGLLTIGMFFKVPAMSPKLQVAFDYFMPLSTPEAQQPALVAALKEEKGAG